MNAYTMYDVAWLPTPAPSAYDVAAGYLASPGVSHVWSVMDWHRAALGAERLLPISAYSPGADPVRDALADRAQCRALFGRADIAIMLDVEQGVAQRCANDGYARVWRDEVDGYGGYPIVYTSGSSAHLFADQHVLPAEWNNRVHLAPGANVVGTQYASPVSNTALNVDQSIILDTVPLYDARHHAPEVTRMYVAVCSDGKAGYWIARSDGAVFSFGTAQYHGGAGTHAQTNPQPLAAPITGMAATPDGGGYWLLGGDGGVFACGNARYAGNAIGQK